MTFTAIKRTSFARPGFLLAEHNPVNKLLIIMLILLAFGLLMMTSASIEVANSLKGDPFAYLKRQSVFTAFGLLVVLVVVNIPLSLWYSASLYLLTASVVLLVLVLIPTIGVTANGATRWIPLPLFNLQPSELAKVCVVLYFAAYLKRRRVEVQEKWVGFLKPMLILSGVVILLLLEPDLGAIVVLMGTAFSMIFLAGAKIHRLLILLMMSLGAIASMAIMYPYVLSRFGCFMNPWAPEQVYGNCYQVTQAQIAFGRGEWIGIGLGNSIQKLHFLTQPHTDFVLAIIGEELGLMGILLVIVLFVMLVGVAFQIGRRAEQAGELFAAYLAYGLGLQIAGQTLINVGVSIQLIPHTGLTLPFLSYGGTSLLMSCFMVALLIRIQYEIERPK